jgi:glycosyltransferase involved in cell wall biosynthesis
VVPLLARFDAMITSAAPLVSIVVPVYATSAHQVALLAETLDTVEQQSCANYEVIVVDDGSPVEITSAVSGRRRVSLLRQSNGGSAVARNAGIAASEGEFFVFLDADDHLLPRALESGLSHLVADSTCGFAVGPREEMTYEGAAVEWAIPPPPLVRRLYNTLLAFDWYIIPPSSAMFRRSVVAQIGGFRDPWGADDLDFYLRAAYAHDAACYHYPAITRYRRYSSSSSRDGERMLKSMRAVYARQRALVAGDAQAEAAFDLGRSRLTEIFIDCVCENVMDRIRARQWSRAFRAVGVLARENPSKLPGVVRQLAESSRAWPLS